jgi:membrane protease YdiL (CAAX protease family)
MQSSSPTELVISDPSVATRTAVGAHSRPLRFVIVALVVAVYIALGFLLHLTTAEYELLGIPILLVFQVGIQRQPLRALWVRSGPPLRLDTWFYLLWFLFSLIPVYGILTAVGHGNLWNAAVGGAAIAGAFGLTYALRAMTAANVRQLGLCLVTAGSIGILLLLLSLFLPTHRVQPAGTHVLTLLSVLQLGGVNFFILAPGFFVVEEVFFRGALDTYLHHGEQGTGWLSAIFVSALWGLWHLPGQLAPQLGQPHLLSHIITAVVGVLVPQVAAGVPLSLWWRKSGNLIVTDTTHAFYDTVRNIILGVVA